jgi:hypothetical protein
MLREADGIVIIYGNQAQIQSDWSTYHLPSTRFSIILHNIKISHGLCHTITENWLKNLLLLRK